MKAASESQTVQREGGRAHTMPIHIVDAKPIPIIGEIREML